MSLQFTKSAPLSAEVAKRLCYVTIAWQQIFERSVQITAVGVFAACDYNADISDRQGPNSRGAGNISTRLLGNGGQNIFCRPPNICDKIDMPVNGISEIHVY